MAEAAGRLREGDGRKRGGACGVPAGGREPHKGCAIKATGAVGRGRPLKWGNLTSRRERGGCALSVSILELEQFKMHVQECQVLRLEEQVQEQRLLLEEQGAEKASGGTSAAPKFLLVLKTQASHLTEIT